MFLILALMMAIGLSLGITFIIIRFAGIRDTPWLEDIRKTLTEIRERIEREDFPLDIKDMVILEGILREKILFLSNLSVEEIKETAKELNMLFMIMKREISPLLIDLRFEEVSEYYSGKALTIEKFMEKCIAGRLSQEEILAFPSERGKGFFILKEEELKRFCAELKEKNSVLRFLHGKKEFLSLLKRMESRLYG